MKSLSSNTATAVDNPHVSPILLVKIAFTSPSALTVYLCSRPFDTRNTFDGDCYAPIIKGWSAIRCGEIDPISYVTRAGDMSLYVMNGIPVGGYASFTKMLYAYDWAFSTVTVMKVHEGALTAGDEENIFVGRIEQPEGMTQAQVGIKISGIELAYQEKWPYTIVNTTDYADADPDDIGKMLPQAWGSCKRVPFRAVDAGWITTLAQDITSSGTGNTLFSDVTGLPSSGTIQIGDEQITFGSKSDANKTLNISARGQNGTTAVTHDHGEKTAEIQADFFYIMGHAVKAIDAVYIGDVLAATADYTAYTGQTGDQHGTYGAKACIKFTVLPILKKQTNLTHTDTVSDTIDVADTTDFTVTETSIEAAPTSATQISGTVTNKDHAIDGDEDTKADLAANTVLSIRWNLSNLGTISKIYFHMYVDTDGDDITLSSDDGTPDVTPINYLDPANIRIAMTPTDGSDWDFNLKFNSGAGEACHVYEIMAGVVYEPELTKSGGASKTGAATGTGTLSGNSVADTVIGGQVSCDIDGYQDDGSGTYTGTPSALIERPDHIFKHLIKGILSLADAQIDSTSYTASGTLYGTNSFALAVCLTEPPQLLQLFAKMAFQCRSLQFWEAGVHHLKYLNPGESSVKTISGHRIDLNQLLLSYTMRTDIKNDLSAIYDKHWSGYGTDEIKSEREIVEATSSDSITKYGELLKEFIFDFITGSTMAQAILNWIKDLLYEPRLLSSLTGDPSLLELERGDVITLDVDETELANAALGLIPSVTRVFRILDKIYMPDFRESLKLVEEKLMADMDVMTLAMSVHDAQAATGSLVAACTLTYTCPAITTDVSYLTLLDTDYQGSSSYNRVWGDGNFIYVAAGYTGLLSYSVDGAGNLTFIDSDAQGISPYLDVFGDGTYIYCACQGEGLRVYSVDGAGNLTHVDSDDQGGLYNGVYCDGTYIICSCGADGFRSYTRDAGGLLTFKEREDQGGTYYGAYGDGTYLYAGRTTYGTHSYTIGANGVFTAKDADDQGGDYRYVWADGSFIYVCLDGGQVMTYTVGANGVLTHKTTNVNGGGDSFVAYDVWGDGTYIYVANAGASVAYMGLSICTVDGNGALTELDRIGNEAGSEFYGKGVWGDGTYIYVASYTAGLKSFAVG